MSPAPSERRLFVSLMAILAAAYLCLYNGYWQPGGSDDAYYLSLARGLARGEGLKWQGVPVMDVPPLWPIVLAGLMKLTSSMAVINLAPLVFTWLAGGLWFGVLRRLTEARRAFWIMLIVGLLYRWFADAIHAYSEGMFCFLAGAGLLLAMQIAEGRRLAWRAPLLLVICAAMVMTRWPGVFMFPVIGASLLKGELMPRLNRRWAVAIVSGLAVVGSYYGTRWLLHRPLEKAVAKTRQEAAALAQEDRRLERMIDQPTKTYIQRGLNGGTWLAGLFWPPMEMGSFGNGIVHAVNVLGWVLLALVLVRVGWGAGQRDWIWLGLLVYVGSFIVMWPKPVGRYMVPAAPLLVLAVWSAAERIARWWTWRPLVVACRWGTGLFLASLVACNLPIWGISAFVARSPRFHELYLAGEYRAYSDLAALAARVNADDDDVVTVRGDKRTGSLRNYRFLQRMYTWMTDRDMPLLPAKQIRFYASTSPSSRAATTSASRPGTKPSTTAATTRRRAAAWRYYVHRPAEQPQRMWHLTQSWLESLTGAKASGRAGRYLEVYEKKGERLVKVALPADAAPLSRVPGL